MAARSSPRARRSQIMANPNSITGQYLTGALEIPMPPARREPKKNRRIKVVGARGNNLKNVTAEIPLGTFTASPASPAAASRPS